MQKSNNKTKNKKGFTLIELMLAVAFLGTLLLSIAMLAMRLVDMYTKGSTMRAINSVGSAVMDDMRSHITSSTSWSKNLQDGTTVTKGENATRQYYRVHTYTNNSDPFNPMTFVDYGAFCTNTYTYIFNYQPAMLRYREDKKNSASLDTKEYLMVGTASNYRPYALVRIKDAGCSKFSMLGMTETEFNDYKSGLDPAPATLNYETNQFVQGEEHYVSLADDKDMVVLIDGSQSDENTDLQLYDFSVMAAAQSNATGQSLYDIAFVLGTTRGGINVKSANNYCDKNSDAIKDLSDSAQEEYSNNAVGYCSVNRFEFVVRQTGGKK